MAVRVNNGAPGIDKTTLAEVEQYGVDRLLGELADELRSRSWRPLPARRVFIPKPGSSELRPLAIAAVRDRIVQAALKIVLEPVFEADFLPCSFGFRPKRSAHDAPQVLVDEAWQGRRWVVETDITNCFTAIPHDKLMQAVEERISDRIVLTLLRAMLRAGVLEGGQVRREVTGTPTRGPLSPLLCNVYLHRLDRVWDVREHGVLVRYCDDLVVMCSTFSPMRHWTDSKIWVHVFYCVLALAIAHLMRRHAEKAGLHLSVRELLDQLADIEETVLLYHDGGKGRPRAQRMLTDMTPTQQQLADLFGIHRYAPTR